MLKEPQPLNEPSEQHRHHAAFLRAIDTRQKVVLTFDSKKDQRVLTSISMPMDYAPLKGKPDLPNRYHFVRERSDGDPHPLSLPVEQIHSILPLEEGFEPAEVVDWTPDWLYDRDWGAYS
jgi:hypothetical protein